MTQRYQSILLILMMLITPITSAFDHCVGMDVSIHLLNNQNTAGQLSTHDTGAVDHEILLKNSLDTNHHNDTNCTVDICGAYDLPISLAITEVVSSSYYMNIDYSSPYGITLSPDLRPPQQIL